MCGSFFCSMLFPYIFVTNTPGGGLSCTLSCFHVEYEKTSSCSLELSYFSISYNSNVSHQIDCVSSSFALTGWIGWRLALGRVNLAPSTHCTSKMFRFWCIGRQLLDQLRTYSFQVTSTCLLHLRGIAIRYIAH